MVLVIPTEILTLKKVGVKISLIQRFPPLCVVIFIKKKINPNYLVIKNKKINISTNKVEDLFGEKPEEIYFVFESVFENYNSLVEGTYQEMIL